MSADVRSYAVDGRSPRVAFSVATDTGEQLLLTRPSGETERLYRSELSISGLTWGPGRSSLTFVDQPADGVARVRIIEIPSGDSHTLAVLDEPHLAAEPCWSRDGQWLAIEAQPTERLRGMTVYIYDNARGAVVLVDPQEEPEPKSACPRFAPRLAVLAYTYTPTGPLSSEVRFLHLRDGRREATERAGLNDPQWSSDGRSVLAVAHQSICQTDLVRIDVATQSMETLLRSDDHVTPILLDRGTALFVTRACLGSDYVPTDSGDLQMLDLSSGRVEVLARGVYSAKTIEHAGHR